MNNAIITVLIIIFFAFMVFIGVRCRRYSTDINGFVLGGRSAGPWLTAFAYGTSYFSAVIFVGYAGQFGWNFGIASTWIGLGNAFIGSLLAWSILGRRTRVMTQHLGSKTMPDFFGERFNSKKLKVFASVITFIFLIPYTASLYNGLSRLFSMAYPSVNYSVFVIIMAVLTGVYVIFGGYMATAVNDFVQGLIMLGGIIAVIAAVINTNGGYMTAMQTLATSETAGWEYVSFLGPNPVFLLFVVLLTSLGTWGLPQMVGKFYAIKNEDAIKKGTVISTFFAIIVAGGCYFLGGFGRLFNVDVANVGFDAVIPTMLSTLSPIIVGVVIVLVLSASMSTLSSLVLTSSSTITLDFIDPLKKNTMKEKQKMSVIKVFIVIFIAISAIIAIKQYSSKSILIAQMMGISWGALAGAFLAPFLFGLYWKKTTKAAVVVSFCFGVALEVIQLMISLGVAAAPTNAFWKFVFTNSLYSGVFAMVGGIILVLIISPLTQKTKPEGIENMFSCYEEKTTSTVAESLGD